MMRADKFTRAKASLNLRLAPSAGTMLPPAPVPPLGDEAPFAWTPWLADASEELAELVETSTWALEIAALLDERLGPVAET